MRLSIPAYILRTKCDVCGKPNKCLSLSTPDNLAVSVEICEHCLSHHTVTLQAMHRNLAKPIRTLADLDD